MDKKVFLFLLLVALPFVTFAQLGFMVSAEGGFAGSTVKSDELPVFINTYNSYFANAGLTTPFGLKQGLAKGEYAHFLFGIGGEKCKATIGFGKYLVRTPHNSAKFSTGEERDIWTELKDATTEVGVRFDLGKLTIGTQMDMIIRTVSVYSQFIYPDGTASFGNEHVLNGVFSNNRLQVGLGGNLGYRILPHIYLVAKCDYVFQTDKSHPEYHELQDLQNFKDVGYLPRDYSTYLSSPYSEVENSISNDIRGLRFGFGIQIMFSSSVSE